MTEACNQLTGLGIALKAQHDLGSAVPSCCNIFGHVARVFLGIHRESSRQSEIADLEFAVCIDEKIARLKISMQDVCGMYVFQPTQYLIDEGLEMCVRQRLPRSDDGGQVTFHQLYYKSVWDRAIRRKEHYPRTSMSH